MPSLFSLADRAAVLQRLDALRPESRAQWGKMTAAEMMKHAHGPLGVATGEERLKGNLLGKIFGPMVKRKMLKASKLSQNSPTVPKWRTAGTSPDFEASRKKLRELIEGFGTMSHGALEENRHPFFGTMPASEWDALQYKHLDHHFRQFGV